MGKKIMDYFWRVITGTEFEFLNSIISSSSIPLSMTLVMRCKNINYVNILSLLIT